MLAVLLFERIFVFMSLMIDQGSKKAVKCQTIVSKDGMDGFVWCRLVILYDVNC